MIHTNFTLGAVGLMSYSYHTHTQPTTHPHTRTPTLSLSPPAQSGPSSRPSEGIQSRPPPWPPPDTRAGP